MPSLRSLCLLLLAFLALPAAALPAMGGDGMVVTAHPDATEAGATMLRLGGNAVDAAVAAAFALAVTEPYSSGIGGGGFALLRVGGALRFLDFREVAPQKATRTMYQREGEAQPALSRDGALAVAVPGAVLGYLELHARWGSLSREQVLAPAIVAAEQGFLVDERYRRFTGMRLERLREDPEAARLFLVPGPDDSPSLPPLGTRIVQPDLARTLRAIAAEGAPAFYEGVIARRIVEDLAARGGILSLEDLAAYRSQEREPLVGSYLGHAIATAPPPSAGGALLLTTLNLLETLPPDTPWRAPNAVHLYIEALKRSFADRWLFGDPAFVDIPLQQLVSKERARALAAGIGWAATPSDEIRPGENLDQPRHGSDGSLKNRDIEKTSEFGMHTTHLSVVDAEGNAVSLTTTVNTPFGAAIVAAGTGVVLNNEMDDFATAPGVPNAFGVVGTEANAVAPGKIPLSSMAPTLVFAGESVDTPLRLVVGSPGGPRIPTTIVQIIHNHLALGAPIDQAIALGRVHHQHLPDRVFYEPFALDAATLGLLLVRGHKLQEGGTWSNATAISIDPATGIRSGAADPRGVGSAIAVPAAAAGQREGSAGRAP